MCPFVFQSDSYTIVTVTVHWTYPSINECCRLRLKCDGTHVETRFRLSANRTSPFKSAGASVQSTTGSRDVRISGSNALYTVFRGSVKSIGCPLHSPVSLFTSPPLRHRVPSHFNWTPTGILPRITENETRGHANPPR